MHIGEEGNVLSWEGGTRLHCTYPGFKTGIALCFNNQQGDTHTTTVLPVATENELDMLIDFLRNQYQKAGDMRKQADEMGKVQSEHWANRVD